MLSERLSALMREDLEEILVSEAQIRTRVSDLGEEISAAYPESEEITVVSIINGAILFTADLVRHMAIPVSIDCIRVSSYRDSTFPARAPELIDTLRLPIEGADVLLIDDIMDTGRTLDFVVEELLRMGPRSLKTCVLLEKVGRKETEREVDFIGFSIPDKFAVGYGLDFAERYRNLPCIGTLKPELQNPPEWR